MAVLTAVRATTVLTLSSTGPLTTETFTIGGKAYQLQGTLTNVNGNVKLGATLADTCDNIVAAVNLGTGAGTVYAAAMTLNAQVKAVRSGNTVVFTAKDAGTVGNQIATTETLTNGAFTSTVMANGTGSLNADLRTIVDNMIARDQLNSHLLAILEPLSTELA